MSILHNTCITSNLYLYIQVQIYILPSKERMQHVPHCGTFVALCSEIKHIGALQSELELCDPPLRELSFWPQPSWSTITPNRELNNSVACTQFPSIMYRGLLLKVLAPLLIMQRKMPLVVHSQSVIIEKRNYMQQGVDSQCVVIGGYLMCNRNWM